MPLHPPPTPPRPIRLAILEAGPLFTTVADKYGTYLTLYSAMFQSSLSLLPTPPPLSTYLTCTGHNIHSEASYPALDDIDAVLISGSHANAFDEEEWIERLVGYTREALAAGKKVVGVCFGHQVLARAVGGRVERNGRGWEVAVTEVVMTEVGRAVFGEGRLLMHQMHRDHVPSLPPPLDGVEVQLLGSSEKCRIQAMYVPGRFISVQGHPEFTGEIVGEMVEGRYKLGVFDEDMYRDFMSRLGRDNGMEVALVFLRFLLGEIA